MKIVTLLTLISLLVVLPLSAFTTPISWQKVEPTRPNLKTGYGSVVDDLEQHVITINHPMRNRKDPGNWVHELTHQINSDLRGQTPKHDNCFYVLSGRYLRLAEPNITLRQVAKIVPWDERGPNYDIYLHGGAYYYNSSPLYVLDEATAYANGLHYHVWAKTSDAWRVKTAKEFVVYSRWLVAAVEKHDPDYPQLAQLKEYVEWNEKRVTNLIEQYREMK